MKEKTELALINACGIVSNVNKKPVLSKVLQEGIRDLRLSFSAGPSQPPADSIRTVQLYAEALTGFESEIQEYVLQYIRLNNPNNPFPPTAQDVNELCRIVRECWRCRLFRFFIHAVPWASPIRFAVPSDKKSHNLRNSYDRQYELFCVRNDAGPVPGEPGCYLSHELVLTLLAESLRTAGIIHDRVLKSLVEMPAKVLERLPKQLLSEDELATIGARRKEAAELLAKQARERTEQQAMQAARREEWGTGAV